MMQRQHPVKALCGLHSLAFQRARPANRAIRGIGQSIDAHKPRAFALQPFCALIRVGHARHGHLVRHLRPARDTVLGRKLRPAVTQQSLYHPSALRSMFNATSVRNTAKIRFSGLGSIAWASLTPQGAVIIVIAITIPKATRLTAPTVSGGRFAGAISRNRNPMTEGTAMVTPNPAAVATAR